MPARMTGREFFGRRLRIARERQVPQLSRRALGERVQMSDSAVAAWESGRNIPDPKTLRSMSESSARTACWRTSSTTSSRATSRERTWADGRTPRLRRVCSCGFPSTSCQAFYRSKSTRARFFGMKIKSRREWILDKDEPPVIVALIDESVLHRNVGGPAVMKDQLDHLVKMATHDHVTVQVITLSSPIGAQYTGPFILVAHDGEPEIAYTDDAISGDIVGNSDDVSKLRRAFELLRKHALSEPESIRLIRGVAEAWEQKI